MRGHCRLKTFALASAIIGLIAGIWAPALAQGEIVFRIGTGSTGGTYFPVGGLIANAISNPPGSLDCDLGGSCGVPGLIAGAVTTDGSVANVIGINRGDLDMALSQADVAYFAYKGKGVFAGQEPLRNLRAVANLFTESVHVVIRRDSGIATVADLKGKRVSLDRKETGTRVVAEIVLEAYGLKPKNLKASYENVGTSADMLAEGKLDAFFYVSGDPVYAIAHLADEIDIDLVLIAGPVAEKVREAHPFLYSNIIPKGTYKGVGNIETLGVGAQLVVAETADDELIYGITQALWNPNNRKVLNSGHPNGKRIRLETALDGIAIPLHPGAARYYEELGMTGAGVF
jgi:TRAP transporter TAXI family solute receptor